MTIGLVHYLCLLLLPINSRCPADYPLPTMPGPLHAPTDMHYVAADCSEGCSLSSLPAQHFREDFTLVSLPFCQVTESQGYALGQRLGREAEERGQGGGGVQLLAGA